MAQTQHGFEDVAGIDYPDVDALEVSGRGASTRTTDAGLIGGGFGVKGALEGIAAASVVNALTRSTDTTIDTVVHLKAGQSEVLMRTDTFERAPRGRPHRMSHRVLFHAAKLRLTFETLATRLLRDVG